MGKSYSSTSKNESSYAKKLKKRLAKDKKKAPKKPAVKEESKEVAEINYLLSMVPLKSSFLGTVLVYPDVTKGMLKKAQKLDLKRLRVDVVNMVDKKGVSTTRTILQDSLKKFPHYYELHAINAIQKFCDILQSGSDKNKLDLLEDALSEMGLALYNGGYSIFNITWFVKIYIAYLNLLNDRVRRAQQETVRNYHPDMKKLKDDIEEARYKSQTLLTTISSIKALKRLNLTLKGTPYIIESINDAEILGAATALIANNITKKVGKRNMRASYINYIMNTILSVCSNIPILFDLMGMTLTKIPEGHRDLILQKRMVITSQGITEFELAYTSGDITKATVYSDKIFQFCISTITGYMENTVLTKPAEVDPFLKLGWIIRKSQPFSTRDTIQSWIKKSEAYIYALGTRRMQYEPGIPAVTELLYDFNRLKFEYIS